MPVNTQKQAFKWKHIVNGPQIWEKVQPDPVKMLLTKIHPPDDIQLQDVDRVSWTGPTLSPV